MPPDKKGKQRIFGDVVVWGLYNGTPVTLKLNSDGELVVNLETADIEIGAVEIKNSTDDTRATVTTKGLSVFDAVANSLIPSAWNYCALTQDTTTDTWVFKSGGASGTLVSTIVITYTSSAKTTISNVLQTTP